MTAEPWQYAATGHHPPLPAIASQWDRVCLDPGKPTPPDCTNPRCVADHAAVLAAADREETLRRLAEDHEAEAAELRREVARLRRTYEPTDEGEL